MHTKIQEYARHIAPPIQRCIKRLGLDQLNSRMLVVYLLNIMDLVFTTAWVFMFGIEIEGNPIARWLYENNAIYLVKTVVVGAGMYLLYKFIPKAPKLDWVTWIIMFVYGAINLYHLFLAIKLITIFV